MVWKMEAEETAHRDIKKERDPKQKKCEQRQREREDMQLCTVR